MASLAQVTNEIRVLLKLLGITLAVVTILFIGYKGYDFYKTISTPPAPPEQKFGELPEIEFPTQSPANIDYRINTLTGQLPTFEDRIMVYKTVVKEPSLVALKEAREKAATADFTDGETKITDAIYQWSNREGQRIQLNILTGQFKITSNFINEPTPSEITGAAATKDGAFNIATEILTDLGEDITDLSLDNSKAKYLKLSGGNLLQTESQGEAQFLRLDIFQNKIDEIEVFYPSLSESPMNFILKSDGPTIVDASFTHAAADLNNKSTYGIKTSEEAFEDLKKGNAYVMTGDISFIDITDVRLGYYLGNEEQQYLLPVIVFEGNNFKAYVNALAPFLPTDSVSN